MEVTSLIGERMEVTSLIGERMEVTSLIGVDPLNAYHFGYALFLALPDLTTKINYFVDLNKDMQFVFIKSTATSTNRIRDRLNRLV